MRRVPPILALVLLAIWLLLNNTVALGTTVLGALLSVVLLTAAQRLRPLQPRMHRASVALRLIFIVLIDIVRSNVAVARIILGGAPVEFVLSSSKCHSNCMTPMDWRHWR